MSTWDILEISVDRQTDIITFHRAMSEKTLECKLDKKVVEQLRRIIHNKKRGYDISYSQSYMQGFPYVFLVFQGKHSLYYNEKGEFLEGVKR